MQMSNTRIRERLANRRHGRGGADRFGRGLPPLQYGSVEANGGLALNLESHLDHDGHPLAIIAVDAVQADEFLPWNWRDTSGNVLFQNTICDIDCAHLEGNIHIQAYKILDVRLLLASNVQTCHPTNLLAHLLNVAFYKVCLSHPTVVKPTPDLLDEGSTSRDRMY
ncbi:hypothetical protein J5N97_026499 [Dioscorea zingiberensis]|uniref:Uncharacterized protein n=1 Tax=Dioscorea zingiberensis TaxID=325984 RepID=A0A9D5C273_9LILI|nr:hypothetical protein J5N97_026499 [Dioscorea zingiberensis]